MTEHQLDLKVSADLETLAPEDMRRVIRDLRLNCLELKRQNEACLLTIEDVKRSENTLRLFLENSYDVLFNLDAEGRFVFASTAWERYFGYPVSDIIGQSFALFVHPDDVAPLSEYLQLLLSSNYAKTSPPYRVKHANGSWIWFEANGMPYVTANGDIQFTGAGRDTTERRKLKEQLIQSQKMEAIGQLAGGLAHDFNNVLSIINGYCSLLHMEAEHTVEQKDYLARIMGASSRAAELTHSMLAFSRTQVMTPQNLNLNMIVSSVGTFVKRLIGEDIHFQTVIKDAFLPVNVDSGQIEQLLLNLATNARDAMPDGGEMTITTDRFNMNNQFIARHGFGEPGEYGVITFSDSGTGMDEATREKLFEPFFTTKEIGKGTGLGLAMVYGITKQHNGFVDVSSEPGQGATFRVYLPIVLSESGSKEAGITEIEVVLPGSEVILIVEDDADLLEFMIRMLTKRGYRVISAANGEEAVEKFKNNSEKIQLIIMDMVMPGMSGKEAYDEIKKIQPQALALFSSGYSAKIIKEKGELGKYAEFISKPLQSALFLKKVREMLDR
ncbi:MAG: ATP-binding protein [Desulfuromonadales bacterium]